MAIINSLLEQDFYTFSVGQWVWKHYPDAQVTFALRNRTKDVPLGRIIDRGELKEELDHERSLRFGNTDLHYLRGTNEYSERMFVEPYLEFLRDFRLPEYRLNSSRGDQLDLQFDAPWKEGIYWETIVLPTVTELYTRALLKPLSRFEQSVVYATGRLRLAEKIKVLRQHPEITFSDFGLRRRMNSAWHAEVVQTLHEELPRQFLGTSNTHLAAQLGLMPMGTSSHQRDMAVAGLRDDGTSGWLQRAVREALSSWRDQYGWALSLFLPDTFGSDFFFRLLTEEDLREWKGFRQDSGDPFIFAEKVLALYQHYGIDTREKLIVFSDGLELSTIIALHERFKGRIRVTFGWGTNLTNDLFDNQWHGGLWYGPLSLVVKPVLANGRGLVKLSDNLAKATGLPADIERYKQAAGYADTTYTACKY